MTNSNTLTRARRCTLITVGLVCVGLGGVGIVVPGLPTTIFLLVASWCFAQSSPRLRQWLHSDPRLGAYLEMARRGSMPLRARIISLAGIWGGIAFALSRSETTAVWLVAVLLSAGAVGTVFVVSMRRA